MPCEYCSPDDESCSVCETYDDPARDNYRRVVVIVCAVGMLLMIGAAAVCAIINQAGGAK